MKNRNDFIGPTDWNDTSNPAVREAERDERYDLEVFRSVDRLMDAQGENYRGRK